MKYIPNYYYRCITKLNFHYSESVYTFKADFFAVNGVQAALERILCPSD